MNILRTASTILVLLPLAGVLVGCEPKPTGTLMEPMEQGPDYDRRLPAGHLALRKITNPADLPDFTVAAADRDNLLDAVRNSLNYLSKPSSQAFFPYGEITHDQAVASLEAFADLVERDVPAGEMNDTLRRDFDVYTSVGWDGSGTVLFTGYYTPILNASRERTERFRYPLYTAPDDLVKGPNGEILGQRTASGAIEPYPTRKQIERSETLAGNELVWLENRFEVYIAHVQGSAKLRMQDGGMTTVGYSASNGREYVSVGKALVDAGEIPDDRLSLRAMIDYFRLHPDRVQPYTWKNPRFVFFTETSGPPRGSLNEPVLPMRSVATDKDIYPRACLTFVRTPLPQRGADSIVLQPYEGFALDQDTGGALRAPGRCDIYRGTGVLAGELAGRTRQEGRLYYLFLKPGATPQPHGP